MNKFLILVGLGMLMSLASMAQPGARMTADERAQREKQNLYSKIDDLSEDQKAIIDGVYEELGQSMDELFTEMRKTRNREEMRPKMEKLIEEKDLLMGDILNEDQYAIYQKMTQEQRERMKKRREEGQKGQQGPPQAQ